MVDMIEIVPLRETVEVRGHQLTVRGVEFDEVGLLVYRFPEFKALLMGGGADVPSLLKLSRPVLAGIVAAGCKQISEESAGNLALGEVVDILAPIVRMTMPRGFGPFVEAISGMLNSLPSAPNSDADVASPNPKPAEPEAPASPAA